MERNDDVPELVAGRYEIVRELGRGGSATVYLARDLKLGGVHVALKALHELLSSSAGVARFELEIQLMAKLSNPHIVPILDSGMWGDRLFFVMKYVGGETLQERLTREVRLPVDDVLRIARELCDALSAAHREGVVHRDVKPSNILLSPEHAWLSDFGVAKALHPEDGARRTTSGIAVGTMAYMSPEQASADPRVDHRSDIYSLGCVLYEALAGVHPFFSSSEARMVGMRFTELPQSLARHRPGLPQRLEAALLKAMATEPADRWQSAKEFAEGLGVRETEESKVAPPTSHGASSGMPPSERGPVARFGLRTYTAGLALVVSATLGIVAFRSNQRSALCSIISANPAAAHVVIATSDADDASGREDFARAARVRLEPWKDVAVVAAPRGVRVETDGGIPVCLAESPSSMVVVQSAPVNGGAGATLLASVRAGPDSSGARARSIAFPDRDSLLAQLPSMLGSMTLTESAGTRGSGWAREARSFAALREMTAAHDLLYSGQLAEARDRLAGLVAAQPQFGSAVVWLAFTQLLLDAGDTSAWQPTARRAQFIVSRLERTEQSLVEAMVALEASRFERACPALAAMSTELPSDHVMKFALAQCMASDSGVVGSVDGAMRFRASDERTLRTLEAAAVLAPPAFQEHVFRLATYLLPPGPNLRWGWRTGDARARYAAYVELRQDTLAHVPLDRRLIQQAAARTVPGTMGMALQRARRLRAQFARRWVDRSSTSGRAHVALAESLELIGELAGAGPGHTSAESELRLADRATSDPAPPGQRLIARARVQLKLGHLAGVAALADSALSDRGSEAMLSPDARAGLALLIGRIGVASRDAARSTRWSGVPIGQALRALASELLALGSLGCCSTRTAALDSTIRRRLSSELDDRSRPLAESAIRTRPISLWSVCGDWIPALSLSDTSDVLVRLQRQAARGQKEEVRLALDRLQRDRGALSVGDISVDYVVQEALLWAFVGDTVRGRDLLTGWLAALPGNASLTLTELPQAAAIGRLFSTIARFSSGPEAETFQARLRQLWSRADPILRRSVSGPDASINLCAANPP